MKSERLMRRRSGSSRFSESANPETAYLSIDCLLLVDGAVRTVIDGPRRGKCSEYNLVEGSRFVKAKSQESGV